MADFLKRTGEAPWVKKMIEKYHERAKSTGAIVSFLLQFLFLTGSIHVSLMFSLLDNSVPWG
jgi:hypothetical protein